jgi:hypothetical protein
MVVARRAVALRSIRALSRNLVNPVLNGPMMNGVQRAEYTIGISGCGHKAIYTFICQVGSASCIAAAGRSGVQ